MTIENLAVYKNIFEASLDAIVRSNETGLINLWNSAAEKMFGYSKNEAVGQPLTLLICAADQEKHLAGFNRLIKTGKTQGSNQYVEVVGRRKDGTTLPIELTISPIQTEHGWYVTAILRDSTNRKNNEASLRKLSTVVEQTGEGVIITDKDGTIEYVNPAFTKLTGYSPDEAIGQNPRILNSGNQDKFFYKNMWNTIITGKTWQGKVIDRKKDGSFHPVLLTISPILNGAGEIAHFAAIHADLTDLESLETQFHQAQKMEAIGTLVGGIAHDFNNMLSGITANLYLAKKQLQGQPEVTQKLASIEDLAFCAADMIKQLLTFSRKGIVSMKDVQLTSFAKESIKFLHAAVPENITMYQDICSDPLQIKGDTTQLHQVLMNLINNARDAVANVDAPSIAIKLESFYTNDTFIKKHPYFNLGSYAHLSVEDNGYGIPEHQIEHLFEPFFTTKEEGKGTGLGLAMVFGAVKSHHGFIEVESIEGEGSTFHVYLPLLKKKAATPIKLLEQAMIGGDGKLILIADDEKNIRDTTTEVLKTMGYRVLQARDGQEAIDLFKKNRENIALSLLDVVMPNMGGVSLAEHIRKIKPNMPLVFMTGYDRNRVLKDNKVISNSELILKPIDFNALSHLMHRFLY